MAYYLHTLILEDDTVPHIHHHSRIYFLQCTFHPILEVEDAEEAIYNQDLTDAADLLVKMIKESEEKEEK